MKGLVLKLVVMIALVSVPAFAQQGTVPANQPETLSWGWLMTLGLIAGVVLGLIIRPRKVKDIDKDIDDEIRRDRAA